MRTLILLRHAKAEAGATNFDDFERALTPRGRDAAARIGAWLAANAPKPALALVSGARRTRQTWDIVAVALAAAIPVHADRALYLATPGEVLARIGASGDSADCIVVVGHNPGIETLAGLLAGPGSTRTAVADLARGFSTAGVAVFTVDSDSWSEIGAAATRLDAFVRPRDL